jgi:hypothetical protein
MKSLFKLKIPFVLLFSLLITTTTQAQARNIHFFGSYNRSFGNIIASVGSSSGDPISEEANKLRNGSVNQFEVGGFINSWGLGIIHNTYAADATTSFGNYYTGDVLLENASISDKLRLKFTGLEILYRKAIFNSLLNVLCKCAVGMQTYAIDKGVQYPNSQYPDLYIYQRRAGSIVATLISTGLDYNINKKISVGIEASFLPCTYKTLKKDGYNNTANENVSRLSTGLKLTLTL